MASPEPTYRPVSREAFMAIAAGERKFDGLLLSPDLVVDQLDLAQARFERCLFRMSTIRGADFSGGAFTDSRFEPTRFAN